MAEGEHLSEQTRDLYKESLPGTEKHSQGRLFAPTGSYTGDPMRLHPTNWLKQSETPAHSDVTAWHGSFESALPRTDDYEQRAYEFGDVSGPDWDNEEYDEEGEPNEDYIDYSVDTKDRPMAQYGSAVGMHFGDVRAALKRGGTHLHPVRIPGETIAAPPRGGFSTPVPGGGIAGGSHKSDRIIRNQETGESTPDTRWSDSAANYAPKATDLVEAGKTIAYRNDVEATGSTSYRALPETARTWSEDVMSARHPSTGQTAGKYGWDDPHAFRNTPHPALVHLAEKGYDPVQLSKDKPPSSMFTPVQLTLGDLTQPSGEPAEDYQIVNKSVQRAEGDSRGREEEFNRGHAWRVQKPDS